MTGKRDYDDPLYKEWRRLVRKRDKCQCRWPGCKKKKKLQCHHIQRWADAFYLRYSVTNGITLCYAHHNLIKNKEREYELFFMRIICAS